MENGRTKRRGVSGGRLLRHPRCRHGRSLPTSRHSLFRIPHCGFRLRFSCAWLLAGNGRALSLLTGRASHFQGAEYLTRRMIQRDLGCQEYRISTPNYPPPICVVCSTRSTPSNLRPTAHRANPAQAADRRRRAEAWVGDRIDLGRPEGLRYMAPRGGRSQDHQPSWWLEEGPCEGASCQSPNREYGLKNTE